jgi:Short C-terminal domain
MRSACGFARIILLSLCSAACSTSQSGGSRDLAALDKAYASGVLTADEYAAKKAALANRAATIAALDKALAAGVLTQDEYAAKKSALASASPPTVPVSSEPAPQAPGPEVNPPVAGAAAPAPAPPPTASAASSRTSSPAPASASVHTYKMKMAQVMDQQGFEKPLVSATMLIPTDWQFQGGTAWNIKDSCNTIQTTVKASGPDGRAFEIFPAYAWSWADDPTFLRQAFAQKAQFGTHACDVQPPVSAADYAKQIIGKIRPNVRIASMESAPELLDRLQQQARQTEQSAAQFHLQQRVRPDVVKARLKYTLNGQAVEEWVVVATVTTTSTGPSFDVRSGRMAQANSYNCRATMVAERAPQGQLDASSKFFDLLNSTFHVNAEWQARVVRNAQAVQQIELKGVRDRAAIVSKNADDIRNIQQQGYENRQRVQDQSFKDFDQVIRGVESYRNPGTGETVELDSNYGHAWVSGNGTYLLSDQAGFNPNTVSNETWTPLEHVKP